MNPSLKVWLQFLALLLLMAVVALGSTWVSRRAHQSAAVERSR
jgi:hypothetical protein